MKVEDILKQKNLIPILEFLSLELDDLKFHVSCVTRDDDTGARVWEHEDFDWCNKQYQTLLKDEKNSYLTFGITLRSARG